MWWYAICCVFLVRLCDCNDIFHDGSKITFHPDYTEAGLFGFAVAFGDTGLIVGAPNATMRGTFNNTGVVFNCSLQRLETRNVTCMPLTDVKTNEFHDGMWFGASLAVGPTGKMVICAPRWLYKYNDKPDLYLNGACYLRMMRKGGSGGMWGKFLKPSTPTDESKQKFLIDNTSSEYANYQPNDKRVLHYAFAQAGVATKITEDTIIIGAPGLLVWSGGIMHYKYNPDKNSIQYSAKPTYNPYFTHDFRPDEYFGYSVESGIFEDGGSILYVAGGPKAKRGFGMVMVLKPATSEKAPLNILAKLEGSQLGSYFGASLRCLDINADGRTDILVGAPNFVKQFSRDDLYDQGAVFVYLNKEQETGFKLEYAGQVAGSEANGAKFGYSIAELGDVDGDGYNDIAISAPWEDNGVGAVYIYGGDKYGLKAEYVQRIIATGAQGFGIGLTRGYDVDKNNCNDLVIGAHESNSVYMYRCIPTVKVQATIKVSDALNLPQNTTNFTAQFCVTVLPIRVYPMVVTMEFEATIIVDPQGKRAAIASESVYNVSILPSLENCEDKIIEIKPAADLSRPITISFDLEPIDRMQDNPTQFLSDAGRVSEDSNLHATMVIQLVKDCGKDMICTPWLEMTLEAMNDPYIPGSDGRLGAIIKVLNKEEPAFGIRVNLTLPSPPKKVPPTCNLQGLNLTCDLPSPFNRNQTSVWEVEFEYTQDMREMGITVINVDVDDPVPNRVISDNAQYLEINIMPVTNITSTGKVLPNATVSVSREAFNGGRNISFVHYFQVSNAGPSDCPHLSATIVIPTKVSLRGEIAGCEESWDSGSLTLLCSWSVRATQPLPVLLPLYYNLGSNGKSLEANGECNITSILFLDNMNITLTTTLVLEPAPQLWIAIIVAVVLGLLLLVTITYMFHKWGFFSRARRQAYNELKQQETAAELLEPEAGPSCSHSQRQSNVAHCDESTNLNCSDNSSETNNSLPPLSFQGPSNESKFSEQGFSSPVTLSGSNALYRSLRRQLTETDPDLVD